MTVVRFCPTCGTARVQELRFCPTCGSDLESDPPIIVAASIESAHEMESAPPSSAVIPTPQTALPGTARPPTGNDADTGAALYGGASAKSPNRRQRWATIVAFGIAIVLVGALGYFGFRTSRDLEQARSMLASTTADLSATQSKLTAESAARTSAGSEIARLDNVVSDLTNQVSVQTQCIASLKSDVTELNRIAEEQRLNFNRGAKGSKLATAEVAARAAYDAAISDYYQAYLAAFNLNYASANSWIAKGNRQIKKANAQVVIVNAEVAAIDTTTKKIETDLAALFARVTSTQSTCGFSGVGST